MSYILAIFLLQLDANGMPYTRMVREDPIVYYSSLKECNLGAEAKLTWMKETSKNLPELKIVDIQATCLPTFRSKGETA